VVLNVRDITERKKTEDELRESRKRLKELNSTKDRFFSILGHDLKNPINNILGLSDLMLEQLKNGDLDSIEDYTRMINHSSKKAIDLLSNLLTWSRSQTGSISYQPETLNLNQLVDDTIDLLRDNATRKSIKLENRIPEGTELTADPVMMELIIRNLISNGIKFTKGNGNVIIGSKEQSDKTTIYIEDTGVGISKKARKKLFRPEYNYSTKGTQKEVGTGLGLLLCKEFVDMHGGKISVKSKEGEGSTFSFTIPK
jgi:signal transduction histidine kinase